MVIGSADELLQVTTRRRFVRMLGAGGAIVLLPSVFTRCSNNDNTVTGTGTTPTGSITFDLRTDVGIMRLTQTQEIIESFFYNTVVNQAGFTSTFSAEEQEILFDLRNAETLHREVIRAGLGAQAVPDFSGQFNTATITQLTANRATILSTARMLETTGLATLNGAGKFIKDARNLLFSGKLASVEGRHLAALRDISGISTTAFAGDDSIDPQGRDVKIEAPTTLARIKALNILTEPLNSNITISNLPDPTQGAVNTTPDMFPATP